MYHQDAQVSNRKVDERMVQVLEDELGTLEPALLLKHTVDEVKDSMWIEKFNLRLELSTVHKIGILEVTNQV